MVLHGTLQDEIAQGQCYGCAERDYHILLLRHVTCWWPVVHAKSLVDTFFLQGLGLGAVRVQGREGDRVAGRKAVKQLESCVGG